MAADAQMNQREPIAFRFRNICTNPNLQVKTMGIVLKWLTEGANRNHSVPNCFLCGESSESQVWKAGWLKEENTVVPPLFHDERQKRRNQKRKRRYLGQGQKRYEREARSGTSPLYIVGHSVA